MVESALSVATLGALLWVLRYLVPKSLTGHDFFALGSALLTAALALLTWLPVGVGVSGR